MMQVDLAPNSVFAYFFRPVECLLEIGSDVLWLLECGHSTWVHEDDEMREAGCPDECYCHQCEAEEKRWETRR